MPIRSSTTLFHIALSAALLVCSCKSRHHAASVEDTGGSVSVLPMSDPHTKRQLVSGFYNLENGAWRWTAPNFSLNLQPPALSAANGALLKLRLTIPDFEITRVGPITLSAKAGDTPLPPETYAKSGEWVYTRDVPASALAANAVRFHFAVDKSLPPSGSDQRTLGLIVTEVRLDRK